MGDARNSQQKEGGKEEKSSGLVEPTGFWWRERWTEAASAAFLLSIFLKRHFTWALLIGFSPSLQHKVQGGSLLEEHLFKIRYQIVG